MSITVTNSLVKEFGIPEKKLTDTIALFDNGDTIPFIARYRKEVTGSLDDQILRELYDRMTYLRNLENRKNEVRASIEEQGKLTDEISEAINRAVTLVEVEDIYRPFKPKRKTRASVAKEKGLEPLSEILYAQDISDGDIYEIAAEYINEEKGVNSAEEALNGAMDIVAENISDNAEFRKQIRSITFEYASVTCKKTDKADENAEGKIYSMYFDFSEPVSKIPSHRILAINRAEKEGFIKVSVDIDKSMILNYLFNETVSAKKNQTTKFVEKAVVDAYDRLVSPSIEREIRGDIFDASSESSIRLFALNLKNLLLTPPLKGKTVLGFDPGYRTGCKLSVVDKTGKVIDVGVIYPTKPLEKISESEKIIAGLIKRHKIDVIAIGNGTASKESEIFIANLLKKLDCGTKYIIVSESGASVYSASKLAAEEFPDFDVTLRSAASIARRLQDPLAELVKIDPKSIGVGQYQHDMKQSRLDEALSGVVEDCVNSVGVDVNTASYSLLSYVSGINSGSAKNIVRYREENGEFKTRSEIKKTPKIGAKAFEQCAGFLRIPGGKEILDNTGIHPESYKAAKELLKIYDFTPDDVKNGRIKGLSERVKSDGLTDVADVLGIGTPTLRDIIKELEKPGRDIRDDFPEPVLREDIMDMNDLQVGMVLTGIVRNVIDFGAFVDIGVHQDGLVHVSEISNRYIKHPSEVLSVGDIVKVAVKTVDANAKKIGLTIKGVKN
ncbi:MAG: RNA-binding transcriptional accessory protein [Oscillospiraceae bacterium]|nr:RNA-binding transcriptional accessory protein [Oscillospiraceae bacterium]